MEQLLVAELRDVIDLTNSLKVWIQLNIPKIEDGNNFGVGIQEEVIAELARAEDSAFGVLDGITQYHAQRAKLVSKVAKYPGIADYLEAVIELDRKEFIDLRMNLTEQRNATAILVDMIQKNHDKIVKPRDSQTMGMY